MSNNQFEFSLKQSVSVKPTGKFGVVIGRSEFIEDCNGYFVRDSDGNEQWWTASEIECVSLKVVNSVDACRCRDDGGNLIR